VTSSDDEDRERAEALLRIGSRGAVTEPVEPRPPPEDLGATDAISRKWSTGSIVASVYIFDSYADAVEIEKSLLFDVAPSIRTQSTVNGSLLLWATADRDDPDAADALTELVSAFAGRE
jgi:hypothetical protein